MRAAVAAFLGLFAATASQAASLVPLCQNPALTTDWQIKACEEDVRGTEYALRNWFPQAIDKATLAHTLDFTNPEYITHIASDDDGLQLLLKTYTFAQASSQFPELNLEGVNDQANRNLAYVTARNLATNALGFVDFAQALASAPDWHTRIGAGNAAVDAIRGQKTSQLTLYMDFVINDLFLVQSYNQSGGMPALPCAVLLPFQFSYSQRSVMPLMLAVGSFPGASACVAEGYRAILIQALGVAGGGLTDSDFNSIPLEDGSGAPSLSNPAPVLQGVVADPKLIQAYVSSVSSLIVSRGQSDITPDFLDQIVAGTNAFFDLLGISSDQRVAFYKALSAVASGQTDIVSLRLGARAADELATLGRRKPK